MFFSFDLFGKKPEFNIEGEDSLKSCFGATLSFLILIILAIYATIKFQVMVTFDDTKFSAKDASELFDQTRVFTDQDINFNFAFTLTADPVSLPLTDPEQFADWEEDLSDFFYVEANVVEWKEGVPS